MTPAEFLRMVLPDDGYLIVATPTPVPGGKTAWWNVVTEDIAELQVRSRGWVGEKRDVYFALASFSEKRVWNPAKEDYKTKLPGAWERRTQANAKSLRSFFLDLDVGPTDPKKPLKKYDTQAEALTALREFCTTVGLPKPTLVDSGYGIHVYWVMDEAMPRAVWQPVADQLKAVCVACGLRADTAITADAARVLRVPGTTNFKRGAERPVTLLHVAPVRMLTDFMAALSTYVLGNNVPMAKSKPAARTAIAGGAPTLPTGVQGNLGASNDPLNGNALVYSCAQMRNLAATRGATASGAQWRAGLTLARYCEDAPAMLLAVSDGYPTFTLAEMDSQVSRLTGGPAKCATFWADDNATCEACPHWTKITSPAQLGREPRQTAPPPAPASGPVVKQVAAPLPYMRIPTKDGKGTRVIVREDGGDGTYVDHPVCPYDFYPVRIMNQTAVDDDASEERSTWIAHLPREGETELKMPQAMLSDPRKLHGFLLSRGLHVNPKEAKAIQFYMTAYLQELARQVDRERMYERLGWHEKHHSFVLPNAIYHRDGTITHHVPSRALEAVTKSAIHTEGTVEAWVQALRFYEGAGNEPYRAFTYLNWGSPLLHMTNQKGILIAAAGDTGRGKTTLLEACAAAWGNPEGLLVGGGKYGATMNAMWEILGTMHSLPLFWDDTTERDPEEMREFMLHISTGRGKERMHGNTHDGRVVTWETMVLSSANTDDVHRVMATGKDSNPHLMRFISIDFDKVDRSTSAKGRADQFKRDIRANYGHGVKFIQYIVQNYLMVQALIIKEMERFDRLLKATSEERHWVAALACAYVGGRIAYKLGLTPFTPRDDEAWLVQHVRDMRITYEQAASGPVDILNEFLENNVSSTLILSPKQSSHVDNIVHRPQGALAIRHEVDTNLIYIARTAMNTYCVEAKASFRKLEAELVACGVLLRRNCYKVLGADTPFAMGQTRCWEIDRLKLAALVKGK